MSVAIEAEEGVLRVTFDRPERKNALEPTTIVEVIDALERASVDDALRVVLLRGAGADFCSGADWVGINTAGAPRPRTGSIQRRTPVQAHRLVALLGGIAGLRLSAPGETPSVAIVSRDQRDEPSEVELTPRELDVLALLAEGASNKAIARQLGISVHTAKFHVGSILDKLDATGRTDAVAHAARRGVINL